MVALFFVSQLLVGSIIGALGFTAPTTTAIDATDIETYMSEQLALGRYVAVIYPISMLFSIAVLWLYIRLRGGRRAITIRHSAYGVLCLTVPGWCTGAETCLEFKERE